MVMPLRLAEIVVHHWRPVMVSVLCTVLLLRGVLWLA